MNRWSGLLMLLLMGLAVFAVVDLLFGDSMADGVAGSGYAGSASGGAMDLLGASGASLETKGTRPKTAEEIAQEKELARLRAEQKRLIEEQRAKDRVLLRTFRSSDDILMTRDGKLTAIDTSIQITRSNIKRLKFKLTTRAPASTRRRATRKLRTIFGGPS